jgi:hypothetical protein
MRQMGGSGWALQQHEDTSKAGELERKPPLRPTGPVIALWAATKLAHFSNQNGNLWSILVYMLGAPRGTQRIVWRWVFFFAAVCSPSNAGCAEERCSLQKARSRAGRGGSVVRGVITEVPSICVRPVLKCLSSFKSISEILSSLPCLLRQLALLPDFLAGGT